MMQTQSASGGGGSIALLLAISVVVIVLWQTWVITPLKILVVLFHEISHGIAAVFTGGRIVQIMIGADEGGRCLVQGGSTFLILSAGYLGSMLWGIAILVGASRTRYDRFISAALGTFLLIIALLYVRTPFGFTSTLVFAAALLVAGWRLPEKVNDIALRVIGLTSCLYAVIDIIDDVLRRRGLVSDATMLADYTGIPAIIWGGIWVALAVAAVVLGLWISAGVKRSHAATAGAVR